MSQAVREIQALVAAYYGMTRNELLEKRRTRDVVRPRQIAMLLSRDLTQTSLTRLGRLFGDMDHTTVLHALRRIAVLKVSSLAVQRDLNTLKGKCERVASVIEGKRIRAHIAERNAFEKREMDARRETHRRNALETRMLREHGYTHDYIAELLDIEISTVQSRLALAGKLKEFQGESHAQAA